jgi:hypothetical protein
MEFLLRNSATFHEENEMYFIGIKRRSRVELRRNYDEILQKFCYKELPWKKLFD